MDVNALTAPLVDRRAERTHLFVVATLYSATGSNPVRVRNLSESGALVEGASLPPEGTAVVLRRGANEAPGTIAWSTAGKAGLAFTGVVDVAGWLPGKAAKAQCQVDAIAFGIKQRASEPTPPPDPAPSIESAAAELTAVSAQLATLSHRIAFDAEAIGRHPELAGLQNVGLRIGRVAAMLRMHCD